MADLEIIMDSHDIIENKNLNSINHSDHNNVKSPNRKENILLLPPPPLPLIPIISINNNNIYPINKSLNGGLFELHLFII